MSKFIVSGVCPHGAVETFETDQGNVALAKFVSMSQEPQLVFVVALRIDDDGEETHTHVLGIRAFGEDTPEFRAKNKAFFDGLAAIDPSIRTALQTILTRSGLSDNPAPSANPNDARDSVIDPILSSLTRE